MFVNRFRGVHFHFAHDPRSILEHRGQVITSTGVYRCYRDMTYSYRGNFLTIYRPSLLVTPKENLNILISATSSSADLFLVPQTSIRILFHLFQSAASSSLFPRPPSLRIVGLPLKMSEMITCIDRNVLGFPPPLAGQASA